jgi:hypothetical protein
MDIQKMREGEKVILIPHREKCTVVLPTGQTVYLLLKFLALKTQEGRCNYIGPVSKTAFAGSRVLNRVTLESRAIHRVLQDAEAIYTIYVASDIAHPGAKTAVKALTTSEPRTKSAVKVCLADGMAIPLLCLLYLTHAIAMHSLRLECPSMQPEPKSPGRVHGDWNTSNRISLIVQKM